MKKTLPVVTSIILMLMSSSIIAQVKSKSFNFVLKTLLSHNVPEITVPAAAMSQGTSIFLDTREPEEYEVSHLPNARFAGYKNFDEKVYKDLPKNTNIIVYCAIGKRSENITQRLQKEGFTNVKNLYGGIFEWVNQGNVVYDKHNKPVDKVHGYSRLWGRFIDKGEKVY